MITMESRRIEVEGHRGTWHPIDEGWYALTPDVRGKPVTILAHCFLLEHDEYGDEAAGVIIDQEGRLLLEDVYSGFDNLEEAGWGRAHSCPICGGHFPRADMLYTRDCHGIAFRLVCQSCFEKAMAKGYDGEYYTEADECIEEDY